MANLEAFRKTVKEYTRQVRRVTDGRPATMEDLAAQVGFTREALSKKLNGRSTLDEYDVRSIVRGLAQLGAIQTRNQARYILTLMDVSDFKLVDWEVDPLKKLEEVVHTPSLHAAEPHDTPGESIEVPKEQDEQPSIISSPSSSPAPLPILLASKDTRPRWKRMLFISLILLLVVVPVLFFLSQHITPTTANTTSATTAIAHPATACPAPTLSDNAQDIYTFATCSSRTIYTDVLNAQNKYDWYQNNDCRFTAGIYHVYVPATRYVTQCIARKIPAMRNFALQVKMTIVQGGSGGLLFRASSTTLDNSSTAIYRIPMDINGSYNFFLSRNLPCNGPEVGPDYCNSPLDSFRRGLYQENTLTVVALKDTIYLYSNGQFVDSAKNADAFSGYIGVFANGSHNISEVTFSRLQIWTW